MLFTINHSLIIFTKKPMMPLFTIIALFLLLNLVLSLGLNLNLGLLLFNGGYGRQGG